MHLDAAGPARCPRSLGRCMAEEAGDRAIILSVGRSGA
jgi:hypothetical protein